MPSLLNSALNLVGFINCAAKKLFALSDLKSFGVQFQSYSDLTALHLASYSGSENVVRAILNQVADQP